jgi:hypothetical protein
MRIEKKEKVKEKARGKALEIQEEVKITQGEESLILEKGDRIQVVKERRD